MKKPKKPTRYKMNGMFRYLLICLMLFTGSAHTAADDDFDAVKKAAEHGFAFAQAKLGLSTPWAEVYPKITYKPTPGAVLPPHRALSPPKI